MKADAVVTKVFISRGKILMNGKNLSQPEFAKAITALSKHNPDESVLVVPSAGLTHNEVVGVLAECRKARLHFFSVMAESQIAQPAPGDGLKPAPEE